MANLVITSDSNRIYIVFNDYTSQAGMPSGDWDKSAISIVMNLSDIDIFFSALNEQQFRFSFNSQLIVDSVDGVAPVSNADLFTKLSDALIIPSGGGGAWGDITGTLTDQTDLDTALDGKQPIATGTPDGTKYLRDDNTWQPVSGGSGLTQSEALKRLSFRI